jgi:hypothetical protein
MWCTYSNVQYTCTHVSAFGKDKRSNKNLHMSLLPFKQLVKKGDKDKSFRKEIKRSVK